MSFHVGEDKLLKYPSRSAAPGRFKLLYLTKTYSIFDRKGIKINSVFLRQHFNLFASALSPLCCSPAPILLLSPGVWLWRHPLSAERVWEHHHCAAAPCTGERGSCQVRLIHQHSLSAPPRCDIYSCHQKESRKADDRFFTGCSTRCHFKYKVWRSRKILDSNVLNQLLGMDRRMARAPSGIIQQLTVWTEQVLKQRHQ